MTNADNTIFDTMAKEYDETLGIYNSLDDHIYFKHLPSLRTRILDVGCGTGNSLNSLKSHFREVYGVDTSVQMLAITKMKDPSFRLSQCSVNSLPFPDKYFDLVISHTTLHHTDTIQAVSEIRRVLNNDGILVLIDVSKSETSFQNIHDFILRYFYTIPRLVWNYGPGVALRTLHFSRSRRWLEHTVSEKHNYFSKSHFETHYGSLLPGAKFGRANSSLSYVVWKKSISTGVLSI